MINTQWTCPNCKKIILDFGATFDKKYNVCSECGYNRTDNKITRMAKQLRKEEV